MERRLVKRIDLGLAIDTGDRLFVPVLICATPTISQLP